MTEHPPPQPTRAPVASGSPRDWLLLGGSVLLLAPRRGGTGATLARTISTAGRRVLRCQVRPDDRRVPLRALSRLLAAVPEQVLFRLSPPARETLADLREGCLPAVPAPLLLVECAVLNLVRVLAEETPLLLVVDGVQWLDAKSARVLRFLAAHVRGLPALVQVAAIEHRRTAAAPAGLKLCPPPLLTVQLGRPAHRRAGPAGRGPGRLGWTRVSRPVQLSFDSATVLTTS